jgi:hypothetical protein
VERAASEINKVRQEVGMFRWCVVALCCIPFAGCSPRPGTSFGFADGKPIYVVRDADKEKCLIAAGQRCGGSFEILEEGILSKPSGGWVEPKMRRTDTEYFVRVKCDNH